MNKPFIIPIKKRHLGLYMVAAVASLGGLLAGFDMGVISGALLFINDTVFGQSNSQKEYI